jgi:hypothetical protein
MPDGSIEFFVRPFQSPGSFGTIIIPSRPSGTHEKAMLTWGAKSKMPEMVPTSTNLNVKCCGEALKEASRDSDIVRITQPGKPENYVDVARARNVKLKKREKNACGGAFQAELNAFWGSVFSEIDAAFKPFGAGDTDGQKSCDVQWALSNVA